MSINKEIELTPNSKSSAPVIIEVDSSQQQMNEQDLEKYNIEKKKAIRDKLDEDI